MSRGLLDDGRGRARSFVLRHQHEHERGQTSSVAIELLGFSDDKQIIPKSVQVSALNKGKISHNKEFFEIATSAEHRCTLVDLCGHEKYLKTTIYGLTGMAPNCAMVIVGANHGIQRMTREHIGLCCALKVPFYIVVTKIDMCPENVYKETQIRVRKVLRRAGRKAYFVREMENDVQQAVSCMYAGNQFAPIFEVSSVTGVGIDLLRAFIKSLTVQHSNRQNAVLEKRVNDSVEGKEGDDDKPIDKTIEKLADISLANPLDTKESNEDLEKGFTEFFVDDTFQVPGVGVVIGGSLRRGKNLSVGDKVLIGPDKSGGYRAVTIKSIHRQCVPSEQVYIGQHATLAIKPTQSHTSKGTAATTVKTLKKTMFNKGMVCVKESENEKNLKENGVSIIGAHTVKEFEADIKVLHHSTTINPGYSPVVHLGVVRQAAVILSIKNDKGEEVVARTGSQVKVRFRFLHFSEYLTVGRAIVFREGRAKGCGKVIELFPGK